MTAVEFTNATLADAIKRANIIAPTRGRELDMYKGFVIDVYPDEEYVTLRTTNGQLYYTEFLYPESIECDKATTWRVSSISTHGVVSNLPITKVCTFRDEGSKLRITSGRMRATIPLLRGGDYPSPDEFMFEPEGMFHMTGFGAALDLVGWAASNDGLPPRCGIYMDSDYVCATNMWVLARVPNKYEFADGRDFVVLPYATLAPILRSIEELDVGVLGNNLIISPTEDIFIKCGLFEPRFDPVNRVMDKEYTSSVVFDKEEMTGVLSRVSKIGSSDRQVSLDVYIVGDSMTLSVKDRNSSEEIEESIDLAEAVDHEMVKYMFSIEYFTEAVAKAQGKAITFNYSPDIPKSIVKFSTDSGYEVCVMPRIDMPKDRGEGDG